MVPMIGIGWDIVIPIRLAKNNFVMRQPERVPVKGDWMQEDITVASVSLACRRAVEIPDWQLLNKKR